MTNSEEVPRKKGWPGPRRPIVGVRMSEQGIAALDRMAVEAGVKRSEVVRSLLSAALASDTITKAVMRKLKRAALYGWNRGMSMAMPEQHRVWRVASEHFPVGGPFVSRRAAQAELDEQVKYYGWRAGKLWIETRLVTDWERDD